MHHQLRAAGANATNFHRKSGSVAEETAVFSM
jgi:hypothetical protein